MAESKKKTKDNEIVMMGDYLGTIEEFVPGKGTHAEEGGVFASIIGEANLDNMSHVASVNGKNIPELRVGQDVFGEIINIRRNNIDVIIHKIRGVDFELEEKASLYVSNLAEEYIDKPEDVFGIGDIIVANILRMRGSMPDLSTKGDYGVVLAFCKRCRHQMKKEEGKEKKLVCPNCESEERRKIASEYGYVKEV